MGSMAFARSRGWWAAALAGAVVTLLSACAHEPDAAPADAAPADSPRASTGTGTGTGTGTTLRLPTGRSADLPYDQYDAPSAPPGMAGLPGFPDLGPPDPTDPSGDHARAVLDRHRAEVEAIPGWQGDGVSRRDGHEVIVVMTRRPVPAEERIAKLDGVPLVYLTAGPFTLR